MTASGFEGKHTIEYHYQTFLNKGQVCLLICGKSEELKQVLKDVH